MSNPYLGMGANTRDLDYTEEIDVLAEPWEREVDVDMDLDRERDTLGVKFHYVVWNDGHGTQGAEYTGHDGDPRYPADMSDPTDEELRNAKRRAINVAIMKQEMWIHGRD